MNTVQYIEDSTVHNCEDSKMKWLLYSMAQYSEHSTIQYSENSTEQYSKHSTVKWTYTVQYSEHSTVKWTQHRTERDGGMFTGPAGSPSLCIHINHTALYVLNSTVLHCVLHCNKLYCTALLCTELHCIALHCRAVHCNVLHCTAQTASPVLIQSFHMFATSENVAIYIISVKSNVQVIN